MSSVATGIGGESSVAAPIDSPSMEPNAAVLAFDFGSPVASAAVARGGRTLAAECVPRATHEAGLLRLAEAVLARARVDRKALAGVVALCGPGSFTGLRIACATGYAIHLALGTPATAVSTLEALALAAPSGCRRPLAVVDALRGEWFWQLFERPPGGAARGLAPPARGDPRREAPPECDLVVGFGATELCRAAALATPHLEPPPLADAVAEAASLGRWEWDSRRLTEPLYLRLPAIGGRARGT